MLHRKWSGFLYRKHIRHHFSLYPPHDFISDVYRSAGKDNTFIVFLILAIPLILLPIILAIAGIISIACMIAALIVFAIIGGMHDYLHDSFHIRNHWLYRVPIIKNYFAKLVDLHYLHHKKVFYNLGIFSFFWDRVFGTFRKE